MTKVANWKRRRTRSLYPPPRVPRFSNKLWLSKKRFKIRLTSKTLTAPCFSLKNMSPLRASSPMMLKPMTMTLMALTASLKLRADLLMVLVTHSLYSKIFFFSFSLVLFGYWESVGKYNFVGGDWRRGWESVGGVFSKRCSSSMHFEGWVFFFFFFFGKGWVEFGYIVFGLNEFQWVFS